MRVGGFSHFAETQIKAFREQNIQKPNFIFAGCTCAQMGERIDKARGLLYVLYVQQNVCNPHIR